MNQIKYLPLKDNKVYNLEKDKIPPLRKISNVSVKELQKVNPNLLVYPERLEYQIEDYHICSLDADYQLKTNNLVGFVGVDDVQLTIGSRFSPDKNENFLMYMLQQVGVINVVDLKTQQGQENLWDFLLYFLFPHFLKKALKQGLFKRYEKHRYNDPNVKGQVDIKRHLCTNLPFAGNVAYNIRELSYNNAVTHLIRHTIEFIQNTRFNNVLSGDSDILSAVSTIRQVTPDYSIRNRHKFIATNMRKISHPYFREYEPLRKLCLQILMREHVSFNNSDTEINGVLIDVSWLWEEYLNTILLKNGIMHPENKSGKGGLKLFANESKNRKIYPDFYHKQKSLVLDAKYKFLNENDLSKDDLYQMFTYMYRLKFETGMLLYPVQNNENKYRCEEFHMHPESYGGKDAKIVKYGFPIPQENNNYNVFSDQMKKSEIALIKSKLLSETLV
jgi:5-methylcytosine-specific restriction endonuclease McrBC regulatory subunit McrC